MAIVTFSSPRMKKDLSVYAVAGDTHTLLSVAKANQVPLDYQSQGLNHRL
ncbi:MAG: hypothetical protein RLY71_3885 [Pseudomonadota bacterium]|jgi:hypothetical protein